MTAHDHSEIIWNSQITEIQGSKSFLLVIFKYIALYFSSLNIFLSSYLQF